MTEYREYHERVARLRHRVKIMALILLCSWSAVATAVWLWW